MILLPLMLLAAAPRPAPATLSTTPSAARQISDLCDEGIDPLALSPASLPIDLEDMPQAYGDEAEPLLDEPGPDDGYAPEEYPEEEQCPMLFVIPFDFWDGELWFDTSAYGPSV